MKDTLMSWLETAETVWHALTWIFAGAVVVLLAACVVAAWIVVADQRRDARSAAAARSLARVTPVKPMPGEGSR
jgi:threonine/homoserine/homoserine lactone efflux protein